jgi:hypothetical protein
VAAAKALNEKTGSYKSWADDAKSELNSQLKKQVEEALNISHFKDFQVSLLSRPLREWYQQQQELIALLPLNPPAPRASAPPAAAHQINILPWNPEGGSDHPALGWREVPAPTQGLNQTNLSTL